MFDSMKIIGIGQCGTRIGKGLEVAGLSVAYVNSDEVDTRGYNIPEDKLLLLKDTGTGKSIIKGQQIAEKNLPKLRSFIKKNSDKNGMTTFIVGGGGGTGGGVINVAVKLALEEGYKVGVVYTLPPYMQGLVPASNSLKTLKMLRQQKLNFFLLADNEYLLSTIGTSKDWWEKVNTNIITNFLSPFQLIRSNKVASSGIGSIDYGEIVRILQHGDGLTDIRSVNIPLNSDVSPEALQSILFQPSLVEGYDYKNTLAYLVCVDVPKDGNYSTLAHDVFDVVKKKCGNSISILGMFNDPILSDSIRVTLIHSGLQLPSIFQSRLKNLKRDEERFIGKKQKAESRIDLDLLVDLDSPSILENDFNL